MKIKFLLLALFASAGLIAADAPKPDAAPDAPAKKGDKGDKGGKKAEMKKPESVSDADWTKFTDAMKAASKDEAVVKAREAKDAKAAAAAMKAAVLKADASLESVFKALEEGRKGKGKGDKKGEGKKPEAK